MMTTVPAAAFDRTVQRYREASRFGQGYVAAKVRLDPLYRDLLVLPDAQFGRVVDLGCGRGQLGIFLLEAGAACAVTAIDCQDSLLQEARQAGRGLAFTAERADLANLHSLPPADTVLLIDVLYQLDTTAQQALLRAAVAAGKRIIIRTGDPSRGWRSLLTATLERMARRFWPHSGVHVNQRPPELIVAALSRGGCVVSIAPCWRGTPFCNILIDARRAEPPA